MSLIRALDISGLFWPIWRAKEGAGRPVGEAAAETVQALREHAARGGADYVVACCDAPGRTFRHEIAQEYKALVPGYAGYKGHRPEKDAAMMACLDRVIAELDMDGIPVLRAVGFEADDVIATLTKWAVDNGHDVEIVSEDKDLLSLVREPDPDNDAVPSVTVVRRDKTRQGYDACVERLGVPPSLVPHLLSLAGDTSDGVLGVPGIGRKTATSLLWGEDVGGEWRPTPFRSFQAIVDAAVEEQSRVEQNERDVIARRVHTGIKKGFSAVVIAEKLKIPIGDVDRYAAAPEPPKPEEYKPRFAKDVRQSLIANAAGYDIGLRLTRLREDVPLDFAAVMAPRVPKPRTTSEWKEQRQKAAEINTAIENAPEEIIMSEESNVPSNDFTSAQVVIQPAAPSPASAPPVVVTAPPSSNAAPAAAPSPAAQTTALALPKQTAVRAARPFEMELEPRTYEEAMLVAEHAADSALFKDIRTPAQAIMLFQLGRKFGLSAVDSLRMIHMIEGKPCMSAQLIVGIVQKSGMAEYFEIEALENTHATWVTKRRGARREVRWTFSVDDAKSAKLGGFGSKDALANGFKPDSNWAKHPKVMCMWRAAVFLARAVYTDLVGGLYTPDEISDVEMEIDGNPPTFGALVAA